MICFDLFSMRLFLSHNFNHEFDKLTLIKSNYFFVIFLIDFFFNFFFNI
jgi:hypothetical protein